MLKRNPFLLAVILAVVMLVGVAGCTPGEIQALQGTLQTIDSVSGNVTVKLKDGSTKTFNFADVKVETIRQALGSASLEIGDQVTIKASKNGEVKGLEVPKAEVGGIIKSLGTGNVTITTKKKGDITLHVTSDTRIRIEDKSTAAFSDLKIGQEVEAKYDVSTKNALRINVDMEEEEGEIEGIIKVLDTANKTVTITTEKKDDITLKVTSDTVIWIEDDGTAAFPDLKVGQKVEAKYDVSAKNAVKLDIDTGEKGHEDKD
jgi:hypothetical protein